MYFQFFLHKFHNEFNVKLLRFLSQCDSIFGNKLTGSSKTSYKNDSNCDQLSINQSDNRFSVKFRKSKSYGI